MTALSRRHRRSLLWLCIVVAALLGLGTQLHGLAHALAAVQSSTHDEALTTQAQACDQCLQFAAVEGQAPAPAATLPTLAGGATATSMVPAATPRGVAFAAYESRAPPAIG